MLKYIIETQKARLYLLSCAVAAVCLALSCCSAHNLGARWDESPGEPQASGAGERDDGDSDAESAAGTAVSDSIPSRISGPLSLSDL